MRADAQRNHDKLVEAAQAAFRENGAQASLDDIARRAGVGPGTLYRHFPTRDDLIAAVMRDWAERVAADADAVIASGLEPREALVEWFDRVVANVGIYRGAAAKVVSAMDDVASPIHRKCQVLVGANDQVLQHIAARGALRDGVESREVTRLVSGVVGAADQAGLDEAATRPMLDIIIAGILRAPDAS
ncbi:TetR family transcriptional regulator [Aeromicrobium sp. SMF47]|uniref:TetR family transcriptional regulator n=2 Tax=Nocardioidaceae TaxID=85015 RepID=A0A5Q2MJK9_9ACTN|nr:TetR family transcriptional regulator [Aeromicrobium yanjiei]MRK01552.1 TetR family transcriptional regulator [Aeromicrobium sp. S22]QGG43247.1 TetR family transcriptional regulator [Aeromicrobium yanjiei]